MCPVTSSPPQGHHYQVLHFNLETGRPFLLHHILSYSPPPPPGAAKHQSNSVIWLGLTHRLFTNPTGFPRHRTGGEGSWPLLHFQLNSQRMKRAMLQDAARKSTASLLSAPPRLVQHLIYLSHPKKHRYPSHILLSLASLFKLLLFASPKH